MASRASLLSSARPTPAGIAAILGDGDRNGSDGGVDVLSEVSLASLSVTPEAIGPFGAAVLAWKVDGPGPPARWTVEVNGLTVPRRGEKVVQPRETKRYVVTAAAGGFRRVLDDITLRVNLAGCSTYELASARAFLENALESGVEGTQDVTLRSVTVTFSPGRISFVLDLLKAIKPAGVKIFDATVVISAGFGLGVDDDGDLVSFGEEVTADVSIPWWVWVAAASGGTTLGGLSLVGLRILLADAREDARDSGRNAISNLVTLLAFLSTPAEDMRHHDVRVDGDGSNLALLEFRDCPVEALRRFATETAAVA
jgi:hypothetical protein